MYRTGRASCWESEMTMQKAAMAVLAAALAAVSWWAWGLEGERRVAGERVRQLEGELAKRGVNVAPSGAATPSVVEKPTEKRTTAQGGTVDLRPYLREIDDLKARLEEMDQTMLGARSEAAKAVEAAAELRAELKRQEEAARSAREDFEREQRLTSALEAELKVKSQRMLQAEQAEKVLQERLSKAEQAARRVATASREIEDLNRRREAALVALERRYREVGDVYRSLSLNAQTREGAALQAGDLSRIQTALGQAEEELRQLRSLNARVAELARAK